MAFAASSTASLNMPGAFEEDEIPASPSLPFYQTEVTGFVGSAGTWRRRDERVGPQREEASTSSRLGSGWLQRCYDSMRRLVSAHSNRGSRDVEAAVTDGNRSVTGAVLEPAGLIKKSPYRTQRRDEHSDVYEVESYHTPADTDRWSPNHEGLASLAIGSDSSPRLLSDEENDRLNRKIDRLMAAIDDRRPIHFAPDAETGEVEIFADHRGEVTDQDEYELERNIAAAPENFGRLIRIGDRIRPVRSPNSLRYANSTDSWASTDSKKSSSNAWERAVAAANVRFAIEHGTLSQIATVVKQSSHPSNMNIEPRRPPRLVRAIAPIPIDFDKPLRISTPSVHSNGSEQDTSSPLFRKSCERVFRETYAEAPESTFQRDVPRNSQLDEWAFISEPPDAPPPNALVSKASSSRDPAFGVFKDASNENPSSKEVEKLAVRSKVLKDISNLRRPGYLKFNSFAKDAKLPNNQTGTTVPATVSSIGFGGAPDAESRRAYIKNKWPGLLKGRGSDKTAEPPTLDGVARRRNEQAIDRPIDTSHYSLSHVRTSVADSSLNADPGRQAHFDLALARLEGRALPPPPSPIHRHPDSAALHDRDIQIEGFHRPLPLRGPRPIKPAILKMCQTFER